MVIPVQVTYEHTIDWDHYWRTADSKEGDDANGSAEFVVDPLLEFLEKRARPDSYADVGCGAGTAAFAVADQFPETAVYGFDAAESILDDNRARAENRETRTISFEQAVLPTFAPGEKFDVVSCFFTLCYVADVEQALQNLYDAVAPDGVLLFTYHNTLAQSQFQAIAESPDAYSNESAPVDPDRFTDRFELVLEGDSLLSYEAIHECLGTWPQSVWSVTDDAERYAAWRQNPLVYVPN